MAMMKWLVFAILIASLLPAGQDMFSEIARELSRTMPASRADPDKAKANPRRAELDKSMAMLRGNPR